MNSKTSNGKHESKVLRFSELQNGLPKIHSTEVQKQRSEPRLVGIQDEAKRKLAEKIIKSGKSF